MPFLILALDDSINGFNCRLRILSVTFLSPELATYDDSFAVHIIFEHDLKIGVIASSIVRALI